MAAVERLVAPTSGLAASSVSASVSGGNANRASLTAAAAQTNSLGALVALVAQRVDLLDKAKIDAVQRRVKALLIDFDALMAARPRVAAAASADGMSASGSSSSAPLSGVDGKTAAAHELRVRELHAALLRWDAAAQQLPVVIARLQSLATLHEESASAVSRLAAAERQISDAQQLLATDSQLIAQVRRMSCLRLRIFSMPV